MCTSSRPSEGTVFSGHESRLLRQTLPEDDSPPPYNAAAPSTTGNAVAAQYVYPTQELAEASKIPKSEKVDKEPSRRISSQTRDKPSKEEEFTTDEEDDDKEPQKKITGCHP